jgi:hypothetical protein
MVRQGRHVVVDGLDPPDARPGGGFHPQVIPCPEILQSTYMPKAKVRCPNIAARIMHLVTVLITVPIYRRFIVRG